MDIEYDPSEEVEDDDMSGTIDYTAKHDDDSGVWRTICSEHGVVATAADGSAASHDEMVRAWPKHAQAEHHGDGTMSVEDQMMLINP